jgi:photosystem II stability/assembly factor-like uncharacterized protein
VAALDVVAVESASADTVPGWVVNQQYPAAADAAWSVACPSTSTCFAVGENSTNSAEILATVDGGAHWTSQAVPAGLTELTAIACASTIVCDAVSGSTVLSTTDGGTTWRSLPIGAITSLSAIACPTTTSCVVTGQNQLGQAAIIATTDAGGTWVTQFQSTTQNFSTTFSSLACPSAEVCFAVGQVGILATTDGGTTWTSQTDFAGGVRPNGQLDAIACPTVTTCEAVTGGTENLVTTSDGGAIWTAGVVATGKVPLAGIACPTVSDCVAVAGDNGNQGAGAVPGALVLSTTDGGTTWAGDPLPVELAGLFGVSCATTADCEAVGLSSSGEAALVGTTSGGTTWSTQTLPVGLGQLFGVSCPSAADCYTVGYDSNIYTGGNSGDDTAILATTDGGTTWSPQAVPNGIAGLQGIACPTTSTCFAVGTDTAEADGSGVITTSDGGATWTQLTAPTGAGALEAIACANVTTCVAVGVLPSGFDSAKVLTTTDGGATWTQQTVPAGVGELRAVSCPSTSVCMAVGSEPEAQSGGVIVTTTDGGSTWTTAGGGLNYLTGVACPTTLDCDVVGWGFQNSTPGVVFSTTDQGTTWNSQDVTSGKLEAVACLSASTCAAVGDGVAAQTSNGSSWTTDAVPAGGFSLSGITCLSAGDCFAVGQGSGGAGAVIMTGPSPLTTTQTTVSASPAAVAGGQRVTYSATVSSTGAAGTSNSTADGSGLDGSGPNTPAPATGTPSGTVTFTTGTTILCTATLSAGSGACTSTQAPLGGDRVTGTYAGDSSFLGSSSSTSLVVGASTTVISVSPSPAAAGQGVTYSATVSSASGSGTPTGTVAFTTGTTTLCTATLSGATGSCTSNSAPPGSDTVEGAYSGDLDFLPSSGTTSLSIGPTTTSISVTHPTVTAGETVTYSATVAATVSGTPTGSVLFTVGSTALCTAPLSEGAGSCSSTSAPGGIDTVTGTYSGDPNFGPSSGSLRLTVVPISSTVTVTAAPSPVVAGQSVTYSATVTGSSSVTPTGSVVFSIGSSTMCTAQLVNGAGSCASNQALQGSDTVTGSYSGDSSDLPSSATTTLVVTPVVTTTVTATPSPAIFGQSVIYAATVAPVTGPGTPTGSVAFTTGPNGLTTLCTATLSGGTGSCAASTAPVGTDTVTGLYSGDASFPRSFGTSTVIVTRAPTTVTVNIGPTTITQIGKSLTYEATVTPSAGSGQPTGTVTFTSGSTTICTAPVSTGSGAACYVADGGLPVGIDTVTATYAGDADHLGSSGTEAETIWTPGAELSYVYRSTLVGHRRIRVTGTGWAAHGDTSVTVTECAGPVIAPTIACTGPVRAPIRRRGAHASGFATWFTLRTGPIDGTTGATCGVVGSGNCYLVVTGSAGDTTSELLPFALATATLAKNTSVPDDYPDTVTASNFPPGDIVKAVECDAGVTPPTNLSTNCDPGTAISGSANAWGVVTFAPSQITLLTGSDYSDTALGACTAVTNYICDVVVSDQNNSSVYAVAPFSVAVSSAGRRSS